MRIHSKLDLGFFVASFDLEFGKYGLSCFMLYLLSFASLRFASPCFACVV